MIALALALAGVVLAAGAIPSEAQTRNITPQAVSKTAGSGIYADSWAVIVGINDYQHPRIPKLRYAVNDARAVERTLLAQGFRPDRIVTLVDGEATKHRIESVLGDDLRRKVGPNDRVLVFFAGHGKTDALRSGEEEGYLIPVDGDPSGLFGSAISMTALRQISDRLPAKHILYIVDACYSEYAVFNRAIADDLLEEMVKKPAIQILTAGRQQDQAQEREGHGVFTQVLVRGLAGDAFTGKDWVALEELGVWMKQRVFAESNRKQLPQFGNISGEGQFVFMRPGDQVAVVAPPAPPDSSRPTVRIEPRQQLGTLAVIAQIDGIEVWLGQERIGETRVGSALLVEQLGAGHYRLRANKGGYKPWEREIQVAADRRSEVMIDIEPLRPQTSTAITTDDGAEMVLIPAGEFWMGSDADDERERPRHRVVLDRYYIDKHEMTNDRFKRFIDARGYERKELWSPAGWQWRTSQHGFDSSTITQPHFFNDPKWNGPTQPVVGVSWWEAEAFCRFVGKRLPTEAEWEKAARGADGRRYPWGESWDPGRSKSDHTNLHRTAPVGSYPQGVSAYGVHDMAGNAAEWVADWYAKDYSRRSPEKNPKGPTGGESKVLRGGSWDNKGKDQRSTFRHDDTPSERGRRIGFRCAKDAEP